MERFFAICHPLRHHLLKGTKRTIKLICMVFIGSFVFMGTSLPMFIGVTVICIVWPLNNKFTRGYPQSIELLSVYEISSESAVFRASQTLAVVVIVFALLVNCYLYIRILQALRKRKCDKTLQSSAGLERNIRQASVMVIANGTVFYLCFIVFLATMSIRLMLSFNLEITNVYNVVILTHVNYTVVLINASINPLIYFITNNSYRHAFKNTLWMHLRK